MSAAECPLGGPRCHEAICDCFVETHPADPLGLHPEAYVVVGKRIECACHPVPERYHTTHYGATEPGSTLEPDYDCPVHFPPDATADPECSCAACDPGLQLGGDNPIWFASRMNVCPDCGNKRCPKAADHAKWQCTGSNAVGQLGVRIRNAEKEQS